MPLYTYSQTIRGIAQRKSAHFQAKTTTTEMFADTQSEDSFSSCLLSALSKLVSNHGSQFRGIAHSLNSLDNSNNLEVDSVA